MMLIGKIATLSRRGGDIVFPLSKIAPYDALIRSVNIQTEVCARLKFKRIRIYDGLVFCMT